MVYAGKIHASKVYAERTMLESAWRNYVLWTWYARKVYAGKFSDGKRTDAGKDWTR